MCHPHYQIIACSSLKRTSGKNSKRHLMFSMPTSTTFVTIRPQIFEFIALECKDVPFKSAK